MDTKMKPSSIELVEGLRKSMHEFNNALTPILANAQLARIMIDDSNEDVREAMDDIVDAAQRAKKLVQEMRQTALELQERIDPEGDAGDKGEGDRNG